MNQSEFVKSMNSKLKLIRTEYSLTQDKMAMIIGISKKTLVEIEKGRRSLNWSTAVAVTTIFSDSEILQNSFGGDLSDYIKAIAFEQIKVTYPQTMGGKVWWRCVLEEEGFRIQQNIISGHYRIIDEQDQKYYSSFDLEETKAYLSALRRG
jgi:DNA-binding XRE family transcriptional regulator